MYSVWLRYRCCADRWTMWRSNTSILGFWAVVQYSYTNYLTFFASLPMLCLTLGWTNPRCLLCKMRKELKMPQKDIYSKYIYIFNIMQLIWWFSVAFFQLCVFWMTCSRCLHCWTWIAGCFPCYDRKLHLAQLHLKTHVLSRNTLAANVCLLNTWHTGNFVIHQAC